jgi:hypothetical protein
MLSFNEGPVHPALVLIAVQMAMLVLLSASAPAYVIAPQERLFLSILLAVKKSLDYLHPPPFSFHGAAPRF